MTPGIILKENLKFGRKPKTPRKAETYRAARRNEVLRGTLPLMWPSSATGKSNAILRRFPSKYRKPHQGDRECARRRMQEARRHLGAEDAKAFLEAVA